jgi:hypothetical protein
VESLVGFFPIILEIFAEKTSKFGTKGRPEEECIYTRRSFKELGTLDTPLSS